MALAIHFDGLIRQGIVRDYADLARFGGVSRARITQIMNLLNLRACRQEELLFLDADSRVTEREVRGIRWGGKNDFLTPSHHAVDPVLDELDLLFGRLVANDARVLFLFWPFILPL
ncbi:MAG: hypothetical protein IAE94_00935 [Chthoniobacterales bacterium]|nr:hypothetical protein [Chthoniobacterales bacterium]